MIEKRNKCANCGLCVADERTLCSFCEKYGITESDLAAIRTFVARHFAEQNEVVSIMDDDPD